MRKIVLSTIALLASVMASLSGALADSSSCSQSLTVGFQDKYILQDYGVDVASVKTKTGVKKVPVSQNEWLMTCGHSTYGLWTSTGLTGIGKFGNRGPTDEIDLEYWYNTGFDGFDAEFSIDYYALALDGPHSGLGSSADDVVQVYGQLAHTFGDGPVKIAPYARLTTYLGVGYVPDALLTRIGSRASADLGGPWSLSGDVAWVHDYLAPKDGNRPDHVRTEFGVTYGHDTPIFIGEKSSDGDAELNIHITFPL